MAKDNQLLCLISQLLCLPLLKKITDFKKCIEDIAWAAWRYEISFRVLKNFSTREEKFCISKWPCNVLFIM